MTELRIDPLGIWEAAVSKANALGLKIQAASANQDDALKALVEHSDDERVVNYRDGRAKVTEQIETLKAKLVNAEAQVKEYARTLLTDVEEGFDVEVAKPQFAALRKSATDAKKALLNFVDEETLNEVAKERGIEEIVSIRGTGSTKSGATGIRRPRIESALVDGEAVSKEDGSVDFTHLSKHLKTDSNEVKAAAYAAAGTDDLNSLTAGTEVTFEVSDHEVTVVISAKKPGRVKAS